MWTFVSGRCWRLLYDLYHSLSNGGHTCCMMTDSKSLGNDIKTDKTKYVNDGPDTEHSRVCRNTFKWALG